MLNAEVESDEVAAPGERKFFAVEPYNDLSDLAELQVSLSARLISLSASNLSTGSFFLYKNDLFDGPDTIY